MLRVKIGLVPLSSSQSPTPLLSLSLSSLSSSSNADEDVNSVVLEQANEHNNGDNGKGYDDNDDGSNMIIANILVSHSLGLCQVSFLAKMLHRGHLTKLFFAIVQCIDYSHTLLIVYSHFLSFIHSFLDDMMMLLLLCILYLPSIRPMKFCLPEVDGTYYHNLSTNVIAPVVCKVQITN